MDLSAGMVAEGEEADVIGAPVQRQSAVAFRSLELPWLARMFAETYNFGTTANFSYNSNITLAGGVASLAPLTTINQTDFNSTQFNAGVGVNTAWDSGVGYLRLSPTRTNASYTYYTGFEGHDLVTPAVDTADASLGINHVTGYGCGNSTVYSHIVQQGNVHTGNGSFMYSGSAQQGNAYAFMSMVNLQNANIVISSNTTLSYWVYPSGFDVGNGILVNSNNSAFVALDVVFKDGTDTRSVATLLDANGVAFNPNSQGMGNYLKLNQWNHVQVGLGALTGKIVDHIDLGWQRANATLGYLGFIDDLSIIDAKTPKLYTNVAALDASWAPQYGNLTGYWPMDGNGFVYNSNSVAATVGTALSPSNNNQSGMAYVNGRVGQGLYLDGVDDYLAISGSNFPNSTSMTFAAWLLPNYRNDNSCPIVLSLGSNSTHLNFTPYCSGSGVAIGDALGDYFSGPGVTGGAWVHLAFTFDGSSNNVIIYVNGESVASATFGHPLSSSLGNTAAIGKDNASSALYTGIIDEAAVWSSVLNPSEIALLYSRQSASFSGVFTSRVMGSPFYHEGATSMNWNTTLPFLKPLPANALSEAQSSYPSLYSGSLDTGLVSHWTFDETALGTVVGGDFADDSGQSDTLTRYACMDAGRPGLFNYAYTNHSYCRGGLAGQVQFNNPTAFTTQTWVRVRPGAYGVLIAFGDNPSGDSGTRDRIKEVEYGGVLNFCIYGGCLASTQRIDDWQWHHVVSVGSCAIHGFVHRWTPRGE